MKDSTATLCTISLSAGDGSCTFPAKKLPVGTYRLVATYSGSAAFDASASATKTLTIAKATSKTVLTLALAKVAYGHEGAEHVSTKVLAEFAGSTPTGIVTVKDSTATLCTISLSAGEGSCTFPAKKLPVGSYRLVATYSGSSDFQGSVSTKKALSVVLVRPS